jgi:hypothetical protein
MAGNDLVDRIAAADPGSGSLMRAHNSAFMEQPLPFYRRFRAVLITVRLPERPVELRFADDGNEAIPVASAAGIYAVNAREGLRLDADQVAPYFRFFYANTAGRTRYLVESGDRVPWFDAADMDAELEQRKVAARALIRPINVVATSDGRFRVTATAIDQKTLLRLSYVVSADGRVEAAEPIELLEGIPVPYVGL